METLIDLLEASVEKFHKRTALVITPGFRRQRWSYDKLWELAGRLAGLLRQRGLGKGDRAVIWAPNRPEWVLAYLACLRAGVILVPLDVRSSADFVARIVEQTTPKLGFTARQTPGDLGAGQFPTLDLEELEDLIEGHIEGHEEQWTEPSLGKDDVAQLMFTSGTTGDPKGVILTHGNLVSNILACRELVPVNTDSRLLSLLPLSHMLEQIGGLWIPLAQGASVVYPTSRQPRTLFKTMQRDRITNLILVPQALELLMGGIEREVRAKGKEKVWNLMMKAAPAMPKALRRWLFREVHRQFGGKVAFFMSGGAYLDPGLSKKWTALGIPVLQGYGTTEASPVISSNTFRHNRLGSVGRMLPEVGLKLAEDGEILVNGANITPGYWKNPEATAGAFEDGWYKTGDLGYLDGDEYLFLKGRKKDLIVLPNGQNVYPEDLELLLNQQPLVKDSVVVGAPDRNGAVEVHAALLLDEGGDADAAVSAVNRMVSDHQRIRSSTVWPDEDFPRTHTLKIRKPLVLDFLQGRARPESASVSGASAAPADGNSLYALAATQSGLPLDQLTPESELEAQLGLDSLGRVELLSAIEEELGIYVDEQDVTPETTLGQLERMVEQGVAAPKLAFPTWGQALWCRLTRAALQWGLVFPAMRWFYKIRVDGRDSIKGLQGPVLFAANHNVKMDNPLIVMAVPAKWRWRLSIAAAADDIFGHPVWKIAAPLLGNGFPFSREGAVRPSLEHLGGMLDDGWSVLIYPEGRNNYGEMDTFKPGAGMVAVESNTAIVPIRVRLNKPGAWDGASFLTRGRVEVRFGEPINFPKGLDYREATDQIEAAVRAL